MGEFLAVRGRAAQSRHAQLRERHAEPVREGRLVSISGQVGHRRQHHLGGVRVAAGEGEGGEQHPLGRSLDAQGQACVGGLPGDPGQDAQHRLGRDRRRRRRPGLGHRVPENLGPVPRASLGVRRGVRVNQGEVTGRHRTAGSRAAERAVGAQLDDRVVPGAEVLGPRGVSFRESAGVRAGRYDGNGHGHLWCASGWCAPIGPPGGVRTPHLRRISPWVI